MRYGRLHVQIGLMVVLMLAPAGLVTAQSMITEKITPRHSDVEQLVAMIWGAEPGGGGSFFDDFANDLIYDAARQVSQYEGRWVQGTAGRSYPAKGGAITGMVPEGIEGRPVVVPYQNAMVVRGTRDALDRLKELIAMLDTPVDMVNIDVRTVDLPQEEFEGWGINWHVNNGAVGMRGGGNQPVGGPQVMWQRGNTNAALSLLNTSSRGRHVQGASVTTHNNSPAEVAFGETVPFFTSRTVYDDFGFRRATVEEINSIFIGTELWVLPRINGDDTVTVQVEPRLSEWVGEVSIPGASAIPITRTAMVRTTVTVRDGESVVIGGLLRDTDTINDTYSGMFSRYRRRLTSNPVIVLTPTIIRHQAAGRVYP